MGANTEEAIEFAQEHEYLVSRNLQGQVLDSVLITRESSAITFQLVMADQKVYKFFFAMNPSVHVATFIPQDDGDFADDGPISDVFDIPHAR
jgi:hypothetical protein